MSKKAPSIKKTPVATLLKQGAGSKGCRVSKDAVLSTRSLSHKMLKDLAEATRDRMEVARRKKVTIEDVKAACKQVGACRGIILEYVTYYSEKKRRRQIPISYAVGVFRSILGYGSKAFQISAEVKPFLSELVREYLETYGNVYSQDSQDIQDIKDIKNDDYVRIKYMKHLYNRTVPTELLDIAIQRANAAWVAGMTNKELLRDCAGYRDAIMNNQLPGVVAGLKSNYALCMREAQIRGLIEDDKETTLAV